MFTPVHEPYIVRKRTLDWSRMCLFGLYSKEHRYKKHKLWAQVALSWECFYKQKRRLVHTWVYSVQMKLLVSAVLFIKSRAMAGQTNAVLSVADWFWLSRPRSIDIPGKRSLTVCYPDSNDTRMFYISCHPWFALSTNACTVNESGSQIQWVRSWGKAAWRYHQISLSLLKDSAGVVRVCSMGSWRSPGGEKVKVNAERQVQGREISCLSFRTLATTFLPSSTSYRAQPTS